MQFKKFVKNLLFNSKRNKITIISDVYTTVDGDTLHLDVLADAVQISDDTLDKRGIALKPSS